MYRNATLAVTDELEAVFESGPLSMMHGQESKSAERKGFSELALFLLGSGFGLFVAILGWSDQIRNFNRDSVDLVNRFIDKTGIQRGDLRRFLKPMSPLDRVAGLTAIMASDRLKTVEQVELTGLFNQLGETSTRLERICSFKYDLTLFLTACMFGVGTISLFTTPSDQMLLWSFAIPTELLIVLIPLIVILVIFGIIIRCNHWEKRFNDQLSAISERS
jgi:hypothetical protein